MSAIAVEAEIHAPPQQGEMIHPVYARPRSGPASWACLDGKQIIALLVATLIEALSSCPIPSIRGARVGGKQKCDGTIARGWGLVADLARKGVDCLDGGLLRS